MSVDKLERLFISKRLTIRRRILGDGIVMAQRRFIDTTYGTVLTLEVALKKQEKSYPTKGIRNRKGSGSGLAFVSLREKATGKRCFSNELGRKGSLNRISSVMCAPVLSRQAHFQL